MATHYISSSVANTVNLYRLPTSNTIIAQVNNNQTVTVLEEFEGQNCEFNLIEVNNTNVYVKIEDTFRLSTTPQSAPYTCSFYYDPFYIEPDWVFYTINTPYYDSKQKKYKIPILTNYKTIQDQQVFEKEAIKQGITELNKYYNKDYSITNINKLLGYYKFASFEDLYVRPISNTRIKALISVPAKYYNAQESYDKVLDIENGVQVFNISTKDLRKKLLYIKTIFEFFNKLLTVSNVTIQNFSLLNEYEKIIYFYEELTNLFELNELSIKENIDQTLEIVLDNCGRFFAASINDGTECKYAVTGLSVFRANQYAKNERTLNFIKNIDSLYLVDPCRISVTDFINKYVLYPPQLSQVPNIKPLAEFNNYNDLLAFVTKTVDNLNKISYNTESTQEYEDRNIEQLKLSILELKTKFSWNSFYDGEKDIFDSVNFSKDLEKISNLKKNGTKYDKFTATFIPEDTKEESAKRATVIKGIYNILSLSQILCKLTPKAFQCLFNILTTTVGEVSGVDFNLTLITISNYSIDEVRTKVFPYLTAAEKRIVLNELLERFCLTKHDLITILKQAKRLTIRETQNLYSNSFEEVKQLILSEITI